MHGIHFTLPFGRGSLWLEWSNQSVGFGHEWNDTRMDAEFFVGHVRGVYSKAGDRGLLADFLRTSARGKHGHRGA